jgi:nucleoside-diphosphate-sugar epimerase
METDAALGEVINLGNPEEHTILEFAEIVAELTDRPSDFVFSPPAVGDDPQRRQPDITLANELLGWSPTVPLEQGLEWTIDYFRKELGIRPVPSFAP